MNQASYQHGYVSEAISTRKGTCFQIRYRVRNGDGTSTHKSERLYGLSAKKAARAVLDQRIRLATDDASSALDLTVLRFVDNYWLPYLERQGIRPSTRRPYDSMLKNVLPSICWRPALSKCV